MRVDRRWLYAALAASLLANLFLAGVLIGREGQRRGAPGPLAPGARLRALPADQRARFATRFAPHRPAIRAARLAVRLARGRVEADIAAPVLDRSGLDADLAALRSANAGLQAQAQGALADGLGELSPASRAALVAHSPDTSGVGTAAPRR